MRGGRLAENRRHNTVEYVHRRTLAHWATSSEPHIISRASLRCRVLSSYAGGRAPFENPVGQWEAVSIVRDSRRFSSPE